MYLLLIFFPFFLLAQDDTEALKKQKQTYIQNIVDTVEAEDPKVSRLIEIEENLLLARHNPMYIAFKNPLTKVQFSFKYNLIKTLPFYFAYSQIMFWDLSEDSRPFEDTTYNPELIYTYYLNEDKVLRSIDFGIWEHNSNGKDGDYSRSYERLYIKLNFEHEYKKWILRASAKFGYIFGIDDTNDNIQDYVGPLELRLSLMEVFRGFLDKSELNLRFFPGGKYADRFDKGGMELGLSFRIGGFDITPSFYMQYFSGYAESLINYDQRVDEFRAGFIF